MSDSVDRWHPSNMSKLALVGASELTLDRENGRFTYFSDYEALFADRGRVLAAIEKRVEGLRLVPPNVGYGDGWQDYNSAIDDALAAIKSSSSDINQERDH